MNKLEYSLDEFVSDVPFPEWVVETLKLFVKYNETRDKETLVEIHNKANELFANDKVLWSKVNRFVRQFSDDNTGGVSDRSLVWNIVLEEWEVLWYFTKQRIKKDGEVA